jgi:diguanylate cyclase (GGDEF)-like protein
VDTFDWLTPRSEHLPYMLSFGFAAVAAIALAWAMWIRRAMARESELLALLRERTVQLEDANRRLEDLSYTDALTGVANRRAFDHALDQEWRRAMRSKQPLSVLMLDIDHFKAFNDTYGHPAGDQCLAALGGTLGGIPRRAGDRVARYGGEEFIALLPSTDGPGTAALAERMRAAVDTLGIPHTRAAGGRVTVSIGHATMQPTEATTPNMLVAAADAALYEAKRTGRNRIAAAAVVGPPTAAG